MTSVAEGSSRKAGTALQAAVRYLSKTDRFEREVRDHLKGFPSEEIDVVIQTLKQRRILCDERAAESFCRSRAGRKAVGSFKLAHELRRKGASEDLISRMCATTDDQTNAAALLREKFRPEPEFQPKAFRFLVSRGFAYDAAVSAVREYFDSDV